MKPFIKLFAILLCSGVGESCSTQYYTNPVIDTAAPDPTIIHLGDIYYAAGTSGNSKPVYPIFTSKDLVKWTPAGHIFSDFPEWTKGDFWAPEFYHMNDKTYCYYTARSKKDNITRIGVAVADTPLGPFKDQGVIVDWGDEAIDAFVIEVDGAHYITWKAYGLTEGRPIELLAQRLSADGFSVEGKPFSLLQDMENNGMEGQCIFKRGEYYYILYSALDCCSERSDYEVRVARSKSFKGPYEKYAGNPILKGDGQYIQSCGHGTMVTAPNGRMYYLCHAFLVGKYKEGRKPILQELYIGDDNWVHFKTGNVTKVKQKYPQLGQH